MEVSGRSIYLILGNAWTKMPIGSWKGLHAIYAIKVIVLGKFPSELMIAWL